MKTKLAAGHPPDTTSKAAMTSNITTALFRSRRAPFKGNRITCDTDQKGFDVRVMANSRRTFMFNCTINTREQRYRICPFPEWTVLAAREHVRNLRREADQGNAFFQLKERVLSSMASLCQRRLATLIVVARGIRSPTEYIRVGDWRIDSALAADAVPVANDA